MQRLLKKNEMSKTVILSFLVFLLTSCTQALEVPKATRLPSTTPPTHDFEVTFDGNSCTVSGPAEVPIGDYSFRLINSSDSRIKLMVTQLLEGHTFQDLVDLQTEPGDNFMVKAWMSKPFYYTEDQIIYIVSLDEAGEHGIGLAEYNHVAMWLCGPFQVIKTRSE